MATEAGFLHARSLRVLVAILAVVAGAEIGARAATSRFPRPRHWPSREAGIKVAQINRLARSGGADVVFVGTSLVNMAIDPQVVTRALGSAEGLTVYNAALSAGLPPVMEVWTGEVVLPRLRPKVLLLGISSFDLFDDEAGQEVRTAFYESDGGKQVTGTESVLEVVDRYGRASRLWEYRHLLRDPDILRGAVTGSPTLRDIGELGRVRVDGRTGVEELVPERRRPNAGPPVGRWELGTKSPAAIRRLVLDAQAHGIAVVLFDMPVSPEFVQRHPNGRADLRAYREAARSMAADLGVPFVETPFERRQERFYDTVHLLSEEGTAFTEELMTKLVNLPDLRPPSWK